MSVVPQVEPQPLVFLDETCVPSPWIPAFAGMTVVQWSLDGRGLR